MNFGLKNLYMFQQLYLVLFSSDYFTTIKATNAGLIMPAARRVMDSFAQTAKRGRLFQWLVGYVLIATRKRKMLVPIASSPKVTWTMSILKSVLDARLLSIVVVLVKKTIGKCTVLYVTQQQQQQQQ